MTCRPCSTTWDTAPRTMADAAAYAAEYRSRWLAFVRGYTEADGPGRSALLARVAERGLDAGLAACGTDPSDDAANALVDPADEMTCEHDMVAASGEFDDVRLHLAQPGAALAPVRPRRGAAALRPRGWRELRQPLPRLRPLVVLARPTSTRPARRSTRSCTTSPRVGTAGYATLPEVRPRRRPGALAGRAAAGLPVRGLRRRRDRRRHGGGVCARSSAGFADVYYLADCELEAGELDKLAPYTRGRWAVRHGRYDFGSYSMLARDLVGWDVIESYDELMLANDSCYLVQPLRPGLREDGRPAGATGGACRRPYDDFTPGELRAAGPPPAASTTWSRTRVRAPDLWRILRLLPRRVVLHGVPVGA